MRLAQTEQRLDGLVDPDDPAVRLRRGRDAPARDGGSLRRGLGRRGGHLLECVPTEVRVGVQMIYHFELSLPRSLDYLTWDFQRDIRADLHKAEK